MRQDPTNISRGFYLSKHSQLSETHIYIHHMQSRYIIWVIRYDVEVDVRRECFMVASAVREFRDVGSPESTEHGAGATEQGPPQTTGPPESYTSASRTILYCFVLFCFVLYYTYYIICISLPCWN